LFEWVGEERADDGQTNIIEIDEIQAHGTLLLLLIRMR
jgi:hypothetical protein